MDDRIKAEALVIGVIIDRVNFATDTWWAAQIIGKPKSNRSGSYISSNEVDPTTNKTKIIFTFKNFIDDSQRSVWINKDVVIDSAYYKSVVKRHTDRIITLDKTSEEKLEYWSKVYHSLMGFTHSYLEVKNIDNIDGIRCGEHTLLYNDTKIRTNILMYPLKTLDGTTVSYQLIFYTRDGKCNKQFRCERKNKPTHFFQLGTVTENTTCILIGESLSTVSAMYQLNKNEFVGVVTGGAHFICETTKHIYDTYATHKIIILADNDITNNNNTGLIATAKALAQFSPELVKVRDKVIIKHNFRICRIVPETFNNQNSDWWDMVAEKGAVFCLDFVHAYLALMKSKNNLGIVNDELVKYRVEGGEQESKSSDEQDEKLAELEGFKLTYKKIGVPILTCSAITGGNGTVIDTTKVKLIMRKHENYIAYRQAEFDRADFATLAKFKAKLVGVNWDTTTVYKGGESILHEIVLNAKPYITYTPIRGGWLSDRHKFGLHGKAIDEYKVIAYDSTPTSPVAGLKCKGTLEEWQQNIGDTVNKVQIAQLIYVVLGYAPIARFGNTKINPLILIKAASGYGKSLLGMCLASMYGDSDKIQINNSAGAAGMENIFADLNDLPLFLDELTGFDKEPLKVLAYLYGNGKGKLRGTIVSGVSQEIMTWRGCGYATSEKTIAELREYHQLSEANTGEETRILNLSLEHITKDDNGILYSHSSKTGYTLFSHDVATVLGNNISKYYGTPLVQYLKYLEFIGEDKIRDTILKTSVEFYKKHEGQAETTIQQRVLKQFGEFLAAVYLTIEAKVCKLKKEEAMSLVQLIYEKWLENNNYIEPNDQMTELINYINAQLGAATMRGVHSTHEDSGWDYVVQNGEYKHGTFPIKFSNGTILGNITTSPQGKTSLVIYLKYLNYLMRTSDMLESKASALNIELLRTKNLIISSASGNKHITINKELSESTNEGRGRANAIRLNFTRLMENAKVKELEC